VFALLPSDNRILVGVVALSDELESGLEANLAIPAMDSAPLGAPPPAAAPLAMAGLQMGAAGAAVQQQQGAAQPRGGVSGFFQNLFGSSAARQAEVLPDSCVCMETAIVNAHTVCTDVFDTAR